MHKPFCGSAICVLALLPLVAEGDSDFGLLSSAVHFEPVADVDEAGRIRLVQAEQPAVTAEQPLDIPSQTLQPRLDPAGDWGFDSLVSQPVETDEEPPTAGAPEERLSARSVSVTSSPDTGGLLKDSPTTQTISAQRRNPVAFDPHIRGFRYGQIYSIADGIWFPVRTDLDSMLTKIDPSLVSGIDVIAGPYGVRYGPAFGFIDVRLAPSPRYYCGYESHASLGSTYYHNGDQFYGRTSLYGGNDFWGYRMHYGNRTGSDYESGDGTRIPSSYQSQTFYGQIGFDLTVDSRIEFRYQHLDQNDTEYALQFFDINYLGTNSYSLSYIDEDPTSVWTRKRIDIWHNITTFHGDNQNASKAPVVDRVLGAIQLVDPAATAFVGATNGGRSTFGARSMLTYGEDGWTQLHVGADFRYDDQRIDERFDTLGVSDPNLALIQTELPPAWMVDPGLFAELSVPVRPYLTTTYGARVDWINTGARAQDLGPIINLNPTDVFFEKNDILYAFFAAAELELTPYTSLRAAAGHSQRPPSLIERYSDGVFLGIVQSGFNRVVGDPNLQEERLWQTDLSLYHEREDFRGRASLYYGWVNDFITFANNPVTAPAGARVLRMVSTDLVTLYGFEMYAEDDLTEMWTVFGAMSYVRGEDEDIDQPIWGVAPLEGQFGLRLHDPNQGRYWGIELAARFVNGQDRNAFIRRVGVPGQVDQLEQETPGFTTLTLRSYYNYSDNLSLVAGVDNLFDNNYIEHLDLRLPAEPLLGLGPEFAFAPGANAYAGFEWVR